ncbi:enoyl-CoA hydratase/isomerase family protein [Nocardia sp. CY41]|uniref:enoyl-CoA hydratase/isomerase family protein n=1 Tax=Nocardia sp. CY41 TaxID=2608686 RepID=UPI00135AC0A9|nr:enoyl-CoA hydratase-related protein [Nocardia sp. CY41]
MDENPTAAVTYSVADAVAAIVLNRPDASNALNRAMKAQLLEALKKVGSDKQVRAVVITAAGKNFCVGQDLAEHVEGLRADPDHAMDTVDEHYNPILSAMASIEVPVVAGISGACVGAGLGLALGADIRIAGEKCKFGTAFTGIGLAADSGLSATLTNLVGASRATGLFLLGGTFDSLSAHAWGLVHRVVADGEVSEAARELGHQLANGPTAAFRAVKQLIRMNAAAPLPEVLEREASAQRLLGASTDHAAAVEAFLDKKQPTFVGR